MSSNLKVLLVALVVVIIFAGVMLIFFSSGSFDMVRKAEALYVKG